MEDKNQKRLIVLIPDELANNIDLAHKVHWAADRDGLAVFYLVLVSDRAKIMEITRRVATMKAVTSANALDVDSKLVEPGSFLQTLQVISRPGDLITVQKDISTESDSFKMIPVSDYLSDDFQLPLPAGVHFYKPEARKPIGWIFTVLGFAAIIAIFAWLEIRLDMVFDGALQKIFLMILFSVVMGLVLVWNKFTYR